MATATADEEPPPPGIILFLPSHHLVPTSSILYQQTSKANFPYFMHPVLVLASAASPSANSKLVLFLPLISLYGVRLDEAREAARQSSSTSPSPPESLVSPATSGNSPSYVLLDQSWDFDSTQTFTSPYTTLFPSVRLAPLSLRTKNKFFIPIGRAWAIESSCLTPYPPRQSWSVRRKALPNPSMFLAPESLELVVALHVQKVAAATPILRTNSSFATRSGWGSAWTTPETVSSEATMPSDVGEEVKSKKASGLNVKAKEFVPLFSVKVEERIETKQEKEKVAEVKLTKKLEAVLEKDAEKEELPFEQLTDLAVKEVEDADEEVTLFKHWGHLAVVPVDEAAIADDLEATKQPYTKAICEKKPLATYRNESRFFRARLSMFNAGKATPKCEDHLVIAPAVETVNPQQEATTTHEDVPSTTVIDELSITLVKDREEYRSPEQAGDEWGDWSCVHSKWNSKSKKPKKVHWKEMDW